MTQELVSTQPYLIRALWQWASDCGLTPQLLVDAQQPGVAVPAGSVKDGQIVLNISGHAVSNLDLGNEMISFSARFDGVPRAVSLPVSAVQAVFARENGQGMAFEAIPVVDMESVEAADQKGDEITEPATKTAARPQFTVVK